MIGTIEVYQKARRYPTASPSLSPFSLQRHCRLLQAAVEKLAAVAAADHHHRLRSYPFKNNAPALLPLLLLLLFVLRPLLHLLQLCLPIAPSLLGLFPRFGRQLLLFTPARSPFEAASIFALTACLTPPSLLCFADFDRASAAGMAATIASLPVGVTAFVSFSASTLAMTNRFFATNRSLSSVFG